MTTRVHSTPLRETLPIVPATPRTPQPLSELPPVLPRVYNSPTRPSPQPEPTAVTPRRSGRRKVEPTWLGHYVHYNGAE